MNNYYSDISKAIETRKKKENKTNFDYIKDILKK